MNTLRGITVKADIKTVLEKLRENREAHIAIVKEARAGYIERAQEALNGCLASLKEGKPVPLHFDLRPPEDYTQVYDVAITMLELEQGGTVDLTADQVRHLLLDDWEWTDQFLGSNALYSTSARNRMS